MDYFNQRIKEYRLMKGYSQDDIAKRLNVSRTVYTQIENGNRKVSADEIIALSEIFQVSTDSLLINNHPGKRQTLDDIDVFGDVVSGYFEVNISGNELIGDIIAINDNGEHTIISPVKKEEGRLTYDDFEKWWETNMLAEGKCDFSSQYNSSSLEAAYYKDRKVVECKYISNSSDNHERLIKHACYMSELKTGELYGIVVFFDISNMSLSAEDSRLLSELTAALSESFESLYYVDIRDDSYVVINNKGLFSKLNFRITGRNFFDESLRNLRTIIHKDDFGKIADFIEKDNLLAIFEKGLNTVVSTHYRLVIDNRTVYYRVRVSVRESDPDHILVAVENVNDNITRDLQYQSQLKRDRDIIEVLSEEYSSVYCVNLANNSFEICKIDGEVNSFLDIEQAESLSYTEIFKICVDNMVYEPDRRKMAEAGSIYNVLVKLKDRKSYTTVYRSRVNGKLQYCEMKIVKIGDDEFPTEVVIGFADRSSEKNHKIERELNIQKILNLSHNLEAVAEINLITGEYNYRETVDLANDEIENPLVIEGIIGENTIKEYLRTEVYEEDRALFESLNTIDGLSKSIKERQSFEVKYRKINGDSYSWKSMKVVLNVQNDIPAAIIGIFNVDREYILEQKRAAEIKQLSNDAYVDRLTGTRNRNAYVVKETEINDMIVLGKADNLAVAVFDINCLKNINDKYGHDKGDEMIKTAAKIICDTFKHSPVFRIGGDEFVALVTGKDFADRKTLAEAVVGKSKDLGEEMPILAVGMADRKDSDHSVSDIFMRADEAMYNDKLYAKKQAASC